MLPSRKDFAPVLPLPPVIIRQENIATIKALLANLTETDIQTFLKTQGNFSYEPVTTEYPFGTDHTPPVFAQFWHYPGMKPCCRVLCQERADGGFALVTKAEVRLLTLFSGDPAKGLGPAALLTIPDGPERVKLSKVGDDRVFRGVHYLTVADATKLMSDLFEEVKGVDKHLHEHGPNCPSCPTGHKARAIAASYG